MVGKTQQKNGVSINLSQNHFVKDFFDNEKEVKDCFVVSLVKRENSRHSEKKLLKQARDIENIRKIGCDQEEERR